MPEEIRYCECGCDQIVRRGNRFVNGHNRRNCTLSTYQKECISNANSGDGNAIKRSEVAAKIAKALIWTEDTLKDESSVTTMLLEVTSMATAAIQNGSRDSLNHMVTCGGGQR